MTCTVEGPLVEPAMSIQGYSRIYPVQFNAYKNLVMYTIQKIPTTQFQLLWKIYSEEKILV